MASSGPKLNLELLTMRKEEVALPKGIHGDNCKLVKCKVVGYTYGMRFFMCINYEHDPIKPLDNVGPKVRSY
jgi:hypothetical protein